VRKPLGLINTRTAAYLLGMPLLADHLDEVLSQFDRSCDDFEVAIYDSRLGRGTKRCGKRHPLWSPDPREPSCEIAASEIGGWQRGGLSRPK